MRYSGAASSASSIIRVAVASKFWGKGIIHENGRWGDWQNWEGTISSDPIATSLMNDGDQGIRIRVLALGSKGALWERTLTVSS